MFSTVYNGRVFIAIDSGLYYSSINDPMDFTVKGDAGYIINIGMDSSPITGLNTGVNAFGCCLIIYKRNSTFMLTGNSPKDFSIQPFSSPLSYTDYQTQAKRTMDFTGTPTEQVSHICMGIAGESGELVEYMKKCLYMGKHIDYKNLIEEIGDVLWYLTALCNFYKISLRTVMDTNTKKLQKRYPNGFNIKDCNEGR